MANHSPNIESAIDSIKQRYTGKDSKTQHLPEITEELENAITPEMRELQNAYMAYVVALAEGTRLVGTAHGCLRDAIKNAPAAAVPQPVTLELALTDQAHTDAAAMLEGRPASPLDANWQRSLALRQHHVTSRSA